MWSCKLYQAIESLSEIGCKDNKKFLKAPLASKKKKLVDKQQEEKNDTGAACLNTTPVFQRQSPPIKAVIAHIVERKNTYFVSSKPTRAPLALLASLLTA